MVWPFHLKTAYTTEAQMLKKRICRHCGEVFYSQYDDSFCPFCWKRNRVA